MAVSSHSRLVSSDSFLHQESDDEESFVVLGHSLPPESLIVVKNESEELISSSAVERSLKLTNSSLELLNSTTSLPSMPKVNDQELNLVASVDGDPSTATTNSSVDLSPDEVQQKVDLLIEENMKLKETLHQNNLAMKKQYETLVTWQEEVMAVHSSHRQKFADIKKYVEKLKLENVELTANAKTKVSENTMLTEEIENLKSQQQLTAAKEKIDINVLRSSFDNLTEFELEAAKKKILDLEQELVVEKSKVHMQNLELAKFSPNQLETLEKEYDKLKVINEQATADLSKQRKESEALQKILLDEIKSLKEQLLKASTSRENIVNVEEQLMASQMHITKLELLRNEDRNTINLNEEKILQLEKQLKEMTDSLETLPALHAQLDIYKSDFEAEQQAKSSLGAEKETIAEDLRNLQRRNQQLLEEVERLRGSDYVHVSREEQASAPQETSLIQQLNRVDYGNNGKVTCCGLIQGWRIYGTHVRGDTYEKFAGQHLRSQIPVSVFFPQRKKNMDTIWKQKFIDLRNVLEIIEKERLLDTIKNNAEEEVLRTWNSILETLNCLKTLATAILSIFSYTYACESFFSEMNFIKDSLQNRMTDKSSSACILLKVTRIMNPTLNICHLRCSNKNRIN